MSPWGAPEGVQPTRGGPLTPSLPGRCPLTAVASQDRTGQGWELHMSPHPLCLSFPAEPRAGGGQGHGHSHLWAGSGKIPSAALCHRSGRDGIPQGIWPGDICGDTSHRLCARASPLPPAAARRMPGCARGRGLCRVRDCAQLPWLCPGSRRFSRWKIPPNPKFPPGKTEACPPVPVPGTASSPGTAARRCMCRTLPWPCREGPGHRGHLSRPRWGSTAGGSPCKGTAGSPAARAVVPIPSWGVLVRGRGRGGVGGVGAEEAASEEERGRGSRELAPAPGSPGAPTAAGGRGPAAVAPAKYLPEWHRAMDQPPTRPALRGKARQSPALRGKARLLQGKAWQSRALGGRTRPRGTAQPHAAVPTPGGDSPGTRAPADPVSPWRGLWG